MSRASVLARGRAFAAAGFIDACVIEHKTGETTDDLTGAVVNTYGSPAAYTGACRVQMVGGAGGGPTESGEASVVILGVTLQLPVVGSEGVERGDRVTITASVNDPDLVNRVFFVEHLFSKSEATSRRLGLVEAT